MTSRANGLLLELYLNVHCRYLVIIKRLNRIIQPIVISQRALGGRNALFYSRSTNYTIKITVNRAINKCLILKLLKLSTYLILSINLNKMHAK